MIPLPKLIWPYKDEECQLLSLAEIKDLQREAMRVALEYAAKVLTEHQIPVGNSRAGEMACEWTYDALKECRDAIRALRIEGEA